MHAATAAIGILASLNSFVIGLPHAARIWKYRNDAEELRGIALGSQWIGSAGTFLWSAYAVLTAQVWVGAPHIVNGPSRSPPSSCCCERSEPLPRPPPSRS